MNKTADFRDWRRDYEAQARGHERGMLVLALLALIVIGLMAGGLLRIGACLNQARIDIATATATAELTTSSQPLPTTTAVAETIVPMKPALLFPGPGWYRCVLLLSPESGTALQFNSVVCTEIVDQKAWDNKRFCQCVYASNPLPEWSMWITDGVKYTTLTALTAAGCCQ